MTEDEIKKDYLANKVQFQNAEKVKVDYLVLDVKDIAKTISVSDEEVSAYYQDNIAKFTQDEQRRVAHILVEFGDDESIAKAKIDDLLSKINAGEHFSELAKANSDDTFSGENGGDLEWIERGVMDPAFDESAFSLASVGAVSAVVKSDFGFHIIKLTDLKAKQVKPLTDVREKLIATVSHEKAQDKFFELQQQMGQISFEFPDSLDDAAQAVELTVQTSDWLTRGGNISPFNTPNAIDAIFSDMVLNDNVNSDVIEVNDELALVVRLNQYQAAETKPLSEVEASIKARLIAQKATDKAKENAQLLLSQLKAGTDITAALAEINASFVDKKAIGRLGSEVEQTISKAAFVLPHPTEGNVSASSVTLSNGDLAIVVLQSVTAGTSEANPSLTKQQTSQLAQSAYMNYVDSLKAEAKITRRAVINETPSY